MHEPATVSLAGVGAPLLTVVPTRQRINTAQQYTDKLIPPALCLFADRRGLLDAEFFAYPWLDAAGG